MDYVTLEGIENRTGIGEENLYGFILKELLDNALDFIETESPKEAKVKVTILKEDSVLRIIVHNSNNSGKPSFSKGKLDSIFNFDTFYSSKRNQYKISRGALGDAFKELLCVPYALARKYGIDWKQPLTITTAIDKIQQTFLVSLIVDRISQTINTKIEELKREEPESNFTEIELRLPVVEDILSLDRLNTFLVDYATINTHIDFTFKFPASSDSNLEQTLNFPQIQPIYPKWTNLTSIYYYSLSEFQNFIFGLDKSNDNLPIYNMLQKTFREGSNMKKTELSEKSVGQLKQTPDYIDQLYFEMRNTMKPISSPSNLSLAFETNKKVRIESIKKRLEQRPSFKVSDIKYKSQFGYYKSENIKFPFFYEIVVASSNSIPYYLDFTNSLNSSVLLGNYSFLMGHSNETFRWQTQSDRKNGNYRNSRNIFDILEYYGYSFKKDKCKKPHTFVIANLVSPRIDYKSYGKSSIDLSPFAAVIAETTVRACLGVSNGISSKEESTSIIGLLRGSVKRKI